MNNTNDYEKPEEIEINLWEYLAVVWKRKWTILAVTLVVFSFATYKAYRTMPIYTAEGTFLIEKEFNILSLEDIFQIKTSRDEYYETQYELLQSRTLIDRVLKRLKVYENLKDESNPIHKRSLIDSFLNRLAVNPVLNTRLVQVKFDDYNPEFAANAVNALFDSFIDVNIENKLKATERATGLLTSQIVNLREEIDEKEKEIQEYGAEKNIITLSNKETTVIEKLEELNRALIEAQIDKVKKEALYNDIKAASPDNIPALVNNELIHRLRQDYMKLNREYMKKLKLYKSNYPEMQRLKIELDSAKKSLENETQNLIKGAYLDYKAAITKEKSLEEVFNTQKQETFQFNSNAIVYNSQKIEIENKKRLLESLLTKESETGIVAGLREMRDSSERIVDRAEVPLYPSSAKKKRNMILGLLIGLAGGIGLAFILEKFNTSVKSCDDVKKYTGLPTLGVVPIFSPNEFNKKNGYKKKRAKHLTLNIEQEKNRTKLKDISLLKEDFPEFPELPEFRETEKKDGGIGRIKESDESGLIDKKEIKKIRSIELIPHYSPVSIFSESYRSIRTALLLSSEDSDLKSIAISSSLPSEGKSATVSNLAVKLAQVNKRVLIVDTDFRKPRQHKIFNLKNVYGLTDYLKGNNGINGLIKSTSIPNLFLINSGPVPLNPAELLDSEKMADLVEAMKQYFDYTLFDTAPILASSDAMVLGPRIDGMILIVWGEKTSREALKKAKEKLDLVKAKILGVIINKSKITKRDYQFMYHYYHS